MPIPTPADLLAGYPIISDQVDAIGMGIVLRELQRCLASATPGAIVELGCYLGTTSLFIRRLLDGYGQSVSKQFHVYDSFLGLPAKSASDSSVAGDQFVAGELAVSKKQLLYQFHHAGLLPPQIHKGWFNQLTASDVPDEIAFAFLDGDFYDSIFTSLQLVWPRMAVGGIVVIDDYNREALPGVSRAVSNYFNGRTPVIRVDHNRAIIVVP